jgi:hypothetical protein
LRFLQPCNFAVITLEHCRACDSKITSLLGTPDRYPIARTFESYSRPTNSTDNAHSIQRVQTAFTQGIESFALRAKVVIAWH